MSSLTNHLHEEPTDPIGPPAPSLDQRMSSVEAAQAELRQGMKELLEWKRSFPLSNATIITVATVVAQVAVLVFKG